MVQQGYLSNNRLIFYRVESAGRVHQASANLQHLAGMQGDAQLQRMEAIAIAWGPAPPDVRSLANGAITTTWYVTQDAIKQDRLLHQAPVSVLCCFGNRQIMPALLINLHVNCASPCSREGQ